jgi:hypothetical protein
MSDKKDIHIIIITGIGFCILYSVIHYTNKYCNKHVSFSKHKDIKYIPSNEDMTEYKHKLYYSSSDYKQFSENAQFDTYHTNNL